MRTLLPTDRPALVLAPMQDVTDLVFMRVLARRGAPDWFVTEYFRVHPASRLDRKILCSIVENDTGKPVFAQLIGSDIGQLVRTARELQSYPIAGIDLNLGCPAPVVCRKNAGGGLLREPSHMDAMVGALREAIPGVFTVKTRLGYASADEFPSLLEILAKHDIDGLTIHARTVKNRYQTPTRPEFVRLATEVMPCPVVANGNVVDVDTAKATLDATCAHGLMVGRGAIRNPWIFAHIRASLQNPCVTRPSPTHRDLLAYIMELYDELAATNENHVPHLHVQAMKRLLAYIADDSVFDYEIRRAKTPADFSEICHRHLDHDAPLPVLPPAESKLFRGFHSLLEKS